MFRVFTSLLACVVLSSCGRGTAAAVDGVEIYWESHGDGPALVFIHGVRRDMSDWANQVAEFEDDYRVITLDLPGHGQSGTPTEDGENSLSHHAEAVEAVRAEAGIDHMVLVGHSLGGFVVGEYFMNYPEHVIGIVAVDSTFHQPWPWMTSPNRDRGFTRTITWEDLIEIPALIALAVDGPVLRADSESALSEMRRLYPQGRFELMPEDVGHNIQNEDPEGFNYLLREFLEEIDF